MGEIVRLQDHRAKSEERAKANFKFAVKYKLKFMWVGWFCFPMWVFD